MAQLVNYRCVALARSGEGEMEGFGLDSLLLEQHSQLLTVNALYIAARRFKFNLQRIRLFSLWGLESTTT